MTTARRSSTLHDLLRRHLIKEEGLSLEPYRDSKGYWTIGVGHLIDIRKGGSIPVWVQYFPITEDQAMRILNDDIHLFEWLVMYEFPWFVDLDPVRKVVLISMCFQLGLKGLKSFKKTLHFVERGCYDTASREMLRSKWAAQTPERAYRLSDAMQTGELDV